MTVLYQSFVLASMIAVILRAAHGLVETCEDSEVCDVRSAALLQYSAKSKKVPLVPSSVAAALDGHHIDAVVQYAEGSGGGSRERIESGRSNGLLSYWTALPSDAESRSNHTMSPFTHSCSRVLNHSGLELRNLTDAATDNLTACNCTGVEDKGSMFPICCHARFALLLEYAAWTLPQFNIVWWLHCGTLIGALREGGFVSHDSDTDVAVLLTGPEDRKNFELWSEQARSDGFQVRIDGFGRPEDNESSNANLFLWGEHLDFYAYSEPANGTIRYSTMVFDMETIFPLDYSCNFHGFLVPCPRDPVRYLQTIYPGNNGLMKPRRKWCKDKKPNRGNKSVSGAEVDDDEDGDDGDNDGQQKGKKQLPFCETPYPEVSHGINRSITCLSKSGNAFLGQEAEGSGKGRQM